MTKGKNVWEGVEDKARIDFYFQIFSNFIPAHGKHLDIGFGDVYLMQKMQEKGFHSFGVDMDQEKVGNAMRKGFNVIVHNADYPMPFRSGVFDVVTLVSILEHVRNPQELVVEIKRILNKGGLCLVQIPNPNFPIDLHFRLPFWGYLPRFARDFYANLFVPSNHIVFYYVSALTKRRLLRLFKDFELVTCSETRFEKKLLPTQFRRFHQLFRVCGIDKIFPLGFVFVFKNKH